ncbi:MAG: DivIVA domain-containing protein [Gaiellales bacterium]
MPFVKPSEIPQVSLRRRGFRGFDRTETEELLANITESYEQVWDERERLTTELSALRGELVTLQSRVKEAGALEQEVARLQGKLGSVHRLDERMRNALLSAEWMSEKRKAETRKESERTLRKAQQRAGEIVTRAEENSERLRAEVQRLQRLERETRETCRALLTSALRELDGSTPDAAATRESRALPHPLAGLEEEEQ